MILIKWQDKKGDWQDFNCRHILHMSRNHVIRLFSRDIGIIVKQDTGYIVNRVDLFDKYKRQNKSVKMLSKCESSDEPLETVGL